MLEDMWDEEVRGCLLYNLYGGHGAQKGGERGRPPRYDPICSELQTVE